MRHYTAREEVSDRLPPHLRRLVLSQGVTAACTGYLARRHDGGLGVVRHRLQAQRCDEALPVSAPVVPLALDVEAADRAVPLIGREIAASGHWRGEELATISLHVAAAPSATDAPRSVVVDFEPATPAARAVEGPLFTSGAMLRRFRRRTPTGRNEIVVSATDVEVVRAALQPIYGSDLHVHQSPWTLEELTILDEAIGSIDTRRVASVTARTSTKGSVSRHLDLTFLDEDLADRLRLFPPALLSVDVVVRPAYSL